MTASGRRVARNRAALRVTLFTRATRAEPMGTMAFAQNEAARRRYFVLLHNMDPPDPEEWRAYMAALDKSFAKTVKRLSVFVATDGGAPDDVQRRELAEIISKASRDALIHVFTTHPAVKSVVTAMRWIAPARAISHHPRQFPVVCEQNGFEPTNILHDLLTTQRSFQPVQIVADIAAVVNPKLKAKR